MFKTLPTKAVIAPRLNSDRREPISCIRVFALCAAVSNRDHLSPASMVPCIWRNLQTKPDVSGATFAASIISSMCIGRSFRRLTITMWNFVRLTAICRNVRSRSSPLPLHKLPPRPVDAVLCHAVGQCRHSSTWRVGVHVPPSGSSHLRGHTVAKVPVCKLANFPAHPPRFGRTNRNA